jgi:hypothetical protein
MQPSSEFCRAQEAHERQRAADSALENVRRIATQAAAMWSLEALAAEKREQRLVDSRAATRALLLEKERARTAPAETPVVT